MAKPTTSTIARAQAISRNWTDRIGASPPDQARAEFDKMRSIKMGMEDKAERYRQAQNRARTLGLIDKYGRIAHATPRAQSQAIGAMEERARALAHAQKLWDELHRR